LSIRYLDHTTDAIIEIKAANLEEAFTLAARSVIETTIDVESVKEQETKEFSVKGIDLKYLLLNWLEEVNYYLITEGFAIHRVSLSIEKNDGYQINAKVFGEKLDLKRHNFKVEIKAPTFHDMQIDQNDKVTMRFLLDL
jgi:SHS2 domain-containing protein